MRWCTPKGSYDNTRDSKKGSEKVLGRVLGKGSEKGPAMGFTVKTGSEKSSQEGVVRKRAEYGFGEYGFKHRAQ